MEPEQKKILVAVDGSEQTLAMVDYLCGIISPVDVEIVLFHVMSKAPESFRDWEKDPVAPVGVESLRKWEADREEKIRDFMRRLRRMLVDAGAPEYSVMISIQKVREGIARDILAEAGRGYDAVLVGRTGIGGAAGRFIGSTASRTAGKLAGGNVWLVGGAPGKGKILIPVDTSDSAMRAAGHVAAMATSNHVVELLHVVRGISVSGEGQEDIFPEEYKQRLLEEAQNRVTPVFAKAAELLVQAGMRKQKIFTKIITGVSSRAAAIHDEAVQGGFGTIAVGRKGVSRVEEFDMGRVAQKLCQIATGLALWIVA